MEIGMILGISALLVTALAAGRRTGAGPAIALPHPPRWGLRALGSLAGVGINASGAPAHPHGYFAAHGRGGEAKRMTPHLSPTSSHVYHGTPLLNSGFVIRVRPMVF